MGRGFFAGGRGLAGKWACPPADPAPFSQAIFVYWLTSNTFSLLQTLLLRIPAIRSALRIPAPPPIPPPDPTGSAPKEGILQRMRKSESSGRGLGDIGILGCLWGSLGSLWGSTGL